MPFYTPLRYPGGKRRLAATVIQILEANRLTDVDYIEPYAGGAAIALSLLFEEYASTIHINDLSRPVYSFWHCVLNETDELCERIASVEITMEEWFRQRAIYDQRDVADLVDLGFAALFLNRTNRSGIIGGGVIGGKQQTGTWKLDARFNRNDLAQRIRKVARYKSRIHLYCQDALVFTKSTIPTLGHKAFAFFDPPYIENGQDLYLNDYQIDDHRNVAAAVQQVSQPWVLTYDYAATKHELFTQRSVAFGLNYSAQSRYQGREVMYLSDNLVLPPTWRSDEPFVMSKKGANHPVRGILEVPVTPTP